MDIRQRTLFFQYFIDLTHKSKMRPAAYSPFNKTYKYISLQNQLSHNKNKVNQKALTDSNLKMSKNKKRSKSQSLNRIDNDLSALTYNSRGQTMATLRRKPKTIHKNVHKNERQNMRIQYENKVMAQKIVFSKCRIVPVSDTEKSYLESKVYKQIAMKYNKKGKNKQLIYFSQPSLLQNSVKSDFNTSQNFCNNKIGYPKKILH